jgi:hypothetical protein
MTTATLTRATPGDIPATFAPAVPKSIIDAVDKAASSIKSTPIPRIIAPTIEKARKDFTDIAKDPWAADSMHQLVYYLRRYKLLKPTVSAGVDLMVDLVWSRIYSHSAMTDVAKRAARAALVQAIVSLDRSVRLSRDSIGKATLLSLVREKWKARSEGTALDALTALVKARQAAKAAAKRNLTNSQRRVLRQIADAAAKEATRARKEAQTANEEYQKAQKRLEAAQSDATTSAEDLRKAQAQFEKAKIAAGRADREDTPNMRNFPSKKEWQRIVRRTIIPGVQDIWDEAYGRIMKSAKLREKNKSKALKAGKFGALAAQKLDHFHDTMLHRLNRIVKGTKNPAKLRQRLDALRRNEAWVGTVDRMTRTQVTTAINSGALAAALDAQEETGGEYSKTWIGTLDDRIRNTHRHTHGDTVPINQPFLVGGYRMQFPGDPTAPPGEVINCRCVLRITPAPEDQQTKKQQTDPGTDIRNDPLPEVTPLPKIIDRVHKRLLGVLKDSFEEAMRTDSVAARLRNVSISDRDIAGVLRNTSRELGREIGGAVSGSEDDPEESMEGLAKSSAKIFRDQGLNLLTSKFKRAVAITSSIKMAQIVGRRAAYVVTSEVYRAIKERTARIHPNSERPINILLNRLRSGKYPNLFTTNTATQLRINAAVQQYTQARTQSPLYNRKQEPIMATPTDTFVPVPPGDPAPHPDNPTATGVTVASDGSWEGVLGLMDQWSSDLRMLAAPTDGNPIRSRPLPLPLLVQGELAPGHDKGKLGVGRIDAVWADGNKIMGKGKFDINDPFGAELARKVGEGFIRFVSLDVDEALEELVPVNDDGTIATDTDPTNDNYSVGRLFPKWRVMGATLLAYPAFPDAFIALADDTADDEFKIHDMGKGCVRPDDTTGTGWKFCGCDDEGAVPANAEGSGPDERIVDATNRAVRDLTYTWDGGTDTAFAADASLPFAPRDHKWDGKAAAMRILDWATDDDKIDSPKAAKGFLVVEGNPQNRGSYGFPVADIIDGQLKLVWSGITAAYAALQGARTPTTIPEDKKTAALASVKAMYKAAAKAFDDPSILDSDAVKMAADMPHKTGKGVTADRVHTAPGTRKGGSDTTIKKFEAEDQGNGCVCPDEDEEGNTVWAPCPCDTDDAVAADPNGQPITALDDDDDHGPDDGYGCTTCPALTASVLSGGGITACTCDSATGRICPCTSTGTPKQPTHGYLALTAAATPFTPDAAHFHNPQFTDLTPVTYNPETGWIGGHIAAWTINGQPSCHIGYADRCITAPRSGTDYFYFHQKPTLTTEGVINTGLLTMDTGHADLQLGAAPAVAHYDNTGTMCASVRAGEDQWGIWVSGVVLPGLTDDQTTRLSLARFSGDWRTINGQVELVAILAVNTPGFPVPARRTTEGNTPYALVAAGALPAPATDSTVATVTVKVDAAEFAKRVMAEVDKRQKNRTRANTLATAFGTLRDNLTKQRKARIAASVAALQTTAADKEGEQRYTFR